MAALSRLHPMLLCPAIKFKVINLNSGIIFCTVPATRKYKNQLFPVETNLDIRGPNSVIIHSWKYRIVAFGGITPY